MRLQVLGLFGLVGVVGGCAGVYAEVATTKLTSSSVSPSGGGASVEASGGSTVGFNLGVEFGSTRQRFQAGYASDSLSYNGGSGSLGAASFRYDFNVLNLADRLKLRLGLGYSLGSSSSASGGMKTMDTSGGGGFAGADVTYFLTWSNAVHVFVGAAVMAQSVPGGTFSGSGVTMRATLSHTFGDVRPDQLVIIPMADNHDIVGILELGSDHLGCATVHETHGSASAVLELACPGGRHLMYIQVERGLGLYCMHEASKGSCMAYNEKIIAAAADAVRTPPAAPAPAPTPTPMPTPTATPAALPVPAPAPSTPTTDAPAAAPTTP